MASYDPDIIQTMADRLYARARSITALWTLGGALTGFIVAGITATAIESHPAEAPITAGTFFLPIALGYVVGKERAFRLKVEAQKLLVQLQIERNTAPLTATAKKH